MLYPNTTLELKKKLQELPKIEKNLTKYEDLQLFKVYHQPNSSELYNCQALDLRRNGKATFSTYKKNIVPILNLFLGSQDSDF